MISASRLASPLVPSRRAGRHSLLGSVIFAELFITSGTCVERCVKKECGAKREHSGVACRDTGDATLRVVGAII